MKVKVNNLKFLKKGGGIPKFLKPYGKLTYVGRAHGKHYARGEDGALYLLYGKNNLTQPAKKVADNGKIFTSRFMGSTRAIGPDNKVYSQSNGRTALLNYRIAESKAKQLSTKLKPLPTVRLNQDARRGTYYNKLLRDGRWYHDLGNGRIDVANSDGTNTAYYMGSNGKYILGTGPKLLPAGATETPQRPVNPRGRRNKTTPVKTTTLTTTQSTTVLPVTTQTSNVPETTTTINAPMYLNLLSDMTMYKNNPDTFVERFGNLNGSYTGFASKTPGLLYATSINDMTDEARNQYLSGLKGLYNMYLKDPTEAINYAKYNFFTPSNNATVGDYAQAQLNGTKPQTPSNFLLESLNWYANNKPAVQNWFSNYNGRDYYANQLLFNLDQKTLDIIRKYNLNKPTFTKKGSKLILRNK